MNGEKNVFFLREFDESKRNSSKMTMGKPLRFAPNVEDFEVSDFESKNSFALWPEAEQRSPKHADVST